MNAYIIDGKIYQADRAVLENGIIKLYDCIRLKAIGTFDEWSTFEVMELN